MRVPEFDPSGPTLILITDDEGEPILRAWRVFDYGANLMVVTGEGVITSARFGNLEEFRRILMQVDNDYPGVLDATLVSVHSSAVLNLLARWTRALGLPLPAFANARDLCDLFYRPAFITFDERGSFGRDAVCMVFHELSDLPTWELMYKACKMLITVD